MGLLLLTGKAFRLEVYEVALGVVFDAGDVVVYPVGCLQSCYLLLVHADGLYHFDDFFRWKDNGVALYVHGFDDVVEQLVLVGFRYG